jgi:hypothetical protein
MKTIGKITNVLISPMIKLIEAIMKVKIILFDQLSDPAITRLGPIIGYSYAELLVPRL